MVKLKEREHIKPLTSLRFIFALMVFCCHLNIIQEFGTEAMKTFYLDYMVEGYLGVSFFFILSGFILSVNYYDRVVEGKLKINDFYFARIARIVPVTWVGLLVSIPITVFYKLHLGVKVLLAAFVFNLALVQSFIPSADYYMAYNPPDWSLSCELFFYISFPWLILFFNRYAGKWTFISISVILSVGLLLFLMSSINVDWHHSIFYVNPLVRIFDFILGIFLYLLYRNIPQRVSVGFGTILESLSIGMFFLFYSFHDSIDQVFRYSIYYWLPMLLIILVFALQSGYLSKLISNKWLFYLGEISFSFYIFHQIVIRYFRFINTRVNITDNTVLMVFLILMLSLGISVLSYELIEKPAKKYLLTKYHSRNRDL